MLSDTIEDMQTTSLLYLALFWKFKTMVTVAIPLLANEKYLELYSHDENQELAEYTFIRLTYRGRKVAEKAYKALRKIALEDEHVELRDPFYFLSSDEGSFILMHHKRFSRELMTGDKSKLLSLYDRRIDGMTL